MFLMDCVTLALPIDASVHTSFQFHDKEKEKKSETELTASILKKKKLISCVFWIQFHDSKNVNMI